MVFLHLGVVMTQFDKPLVPSTAKTLKPATKKQDGEMVFVTEVPDNPEGPTETLLGVKVCLNTTSSWTIWMQYEQPKYNTFQS